MKGLLLLSAGIDSPVAAHLLLKQGVKLIALHLNNSAPGVDTSINLSTELVHKLEAIHNTKIPLYVIQNHSNEKLIWDNTNKRFQCILCKRLMYRLAEALAKKEGCDFLVSGENLGQVASQTLENMVVLTESIRMPILRPLLCLDKRDIIKIAEKTGTYTLSAQQSTHICPFLPHSPLTKAKLDEVRYEESKLDLGKMLADSLATYQQIPSSDSKFYDKVAKKFGGYTTTGKYIQEFPKENPEELFKTNLIKCAGKDKVGLDLGCADGRFTLSMAGHFNKLIGIDLSKEMLAVAERSRADAGVKNVSFEEKNASGTGYPAGSFDVIYSRRGPTPLDEINRLLKKGGYYATIMIGEQDCRSLQEAFGRGQGYGSWDISRMQNEKNALQERGFEAILLEEFTYQEYYPTYDDLCVFLEGVPIFQDFDPKKDEPKLREYSVNHTSGKGIQLERHRIVLLAKKL